MTEEYEMFPAMHVMNFYSFQHTTQNIYAWLIVYYGNLIFMIIHMVYYVVNRIIMFGSFENFLHAHFFYHEHGIHFFSNSIYIIIIAVEIFVTHSYYIAEEKAKLQKFVRIKWNYVSRGEVVSNGVNYPSATNFNDLTSRGTQERSKIPPYITNVLQD
ncbi:Hypothetical protein CINCED_3A023310 [Cinara cedri]|nr:Hypothetical protein CINCED_3A023310 [Cinara cedri]